MTDAQARADAHRAVTAILAGRLAPTLDPGHVADLILDALHDLRWRHVPAPQPITAQGRPDPATAKAGAEYARELMAERNRTKETDQ